MAEYIEREKQLSCSEVLEIENTEKKMAPFRRQLR